ncbi:MAG TPA: filamentous hemagglutinin N-terminal domain-containing protein, partial [Steroidobacteraceae bacterium]|nr:filamentous hemagglutinin N-terminal domain-containing protein [Steroidobacteraceae bacterium]
MNRAFRLIWNEALNTWVPVAEIARGRRKRNRRTAAVTLLAMLGLTAMDASAAPPAPAELPHNGHVVTGVATIDSSTSADGAVMNINQSTQRAIIDWDTFNVGSAAQVNFNQPGRDAATLNRVLDANPSQIFGKITATGQVFLTNPNGVYFGKTASVNVGGLVATTHSIDNDDFMAGKSTFKRDGATGSVTNEGTLQTSLGGYIALLAPEVRNSGVVVAQLGTVAMAAGESFTLNFQGHHLTSLTVEPSQIRALVDNKSAVLAPGGTIILSAQALDRLQGGVVRNSGTLEATGMSMKDGHIVLEASSAVENSGTINANAGTDGSPAGTISIDAPQITNSGTITAAAVSSPDAATVAHAIGGHIELTANTIQQSSAGKIDVSGAVGGTVAMHASEDVSLQGVVRAASVAELPSEVSADADLASVLIDAANDVTLQNVTIDVSGELKAGQIVVTGGRAPSPLDPSGARPTLALIGAPELRTSSRRGRGGSVSL